MQKVLEHSKLLKRDTVNYGTALTWTIYFFLFEKHLPQPEIKSTRRIHLEIRFILPSVSFGPRSFTENLFLSKVLLILFHYFIMYLVKNSIQRNVNRRREKRVGARREKSLSFTKITSRNESCNLSF